MGTDAIGRRCLIVKPPAVNNFADDHGVEAPGLVARLGTDRIGLPAAGRGKGISRRRFASPGLDRYERSDAQGFFADEIKAILADILDKTQEARALVEKTKTDDRIFILPVMFALIIIKHCLKSHLFIIVKAYL